MSAGRSTAVAEDSEVVASPTCKRAAFKHGARVHISHRHLHDRVQVALGAMQISDADGHGLGRV